MKLQRYIILIFASLITFLVACHSNRESKTATLAPDAHRVIAEEIIQVTGYTYVRVSSDVSDYWIAINKADVEEGKTYYWSKGAEMKDFTSTELKRTFPSIFFVQDFTDQPITGLPQIPTTSMAGRQQPPEYRGIVIPKAEEGVTVAGLYANKSSLAGKKIRICGQVVKFSGGIMNKNWVHIQDGTKDGVNYDLAVTTQDLLKVGDVVVFEGIVTLNKDVGAGYFYDVILEDAIVKK
jgi:hypothetical protein